MTVLSQYAVEQRVWKGTSGDRYVCVCVCVWLCTYLELYMCVVTFVNPPPKKK